MNRTHVFHGPSSPRAAFSLLSVLAVLALACFPSLSQAEEATGGQYTPDIPQIPSEETPPKDDGDGGANNNTGDGGNDARASEDPDGAAGGVKDGSGSGGGGTTGQGNQGSDRSGGDGAGDRGAAAQKIADGKSIGGGFDEQTSPAAVGDDSSSPLVPILIAIAVLAAISVGAFYYRQRRHDADSPVSPRAS